MILGNGVQVLIKELWQAAVNLRGSIEGAKLDREIVKIIAEVSTGVEVAGV